MFVFALFASLFPLALLIYGIITMNSSVLFGAVSALASFATAILIQKKFIFLKKATFNLCIAFILMSVFAGTVLGFYELIPWWDKLLHFLSGLLFAQIGKEIYIFYGGNKKNNRLYILFSISFAFGVAGLWEIWEFTGDNILKTNAQGGSLTDTMLDIIFGCVGAPLLFIYTLLFRKNRI